MANADHITRVGFGVHKRLLFCIGPACVRSSQVRRRPAGRVERRVRRVVVGRGGVVLLRAEAARLRRGHLRRVVGRRLPRVDQRRDRERDRGRREGVACKG